MKQIKKLGALVLAAALVSGAMTACNGNREVDSQSTVSQNSELSQVSQTSEASGQESQPTEEKAKLNYSKIGTAVQDKAGLYRLNKDLGVKNNFDTFVVNNQIVLEEYNLHTSDEGYDISFHIYNPANDTVTTKTVTTPRYCTTSVYENRIILCDVTDYIIYVYDSDVNYLGKIAVEESFSSNIYFSPDFTRLYYFTWNDNYQWDSEITVMDISDLSASTHETTQIDTGLLNPTVNMCRSANYLVISGTEKSRYRDVQKYLSFADNKFVDLDIDVPVGNAIELSGDGSYFSICYDEYIDFGRAGEANNHADFSCNDFYWDSDGNTVVLTYADYDAYNQEYTNYDLTDGSALNKLVFSMGEDDASYSFKGYCSVPMPSYHAIAIIETAADTDNVVVYLWDLTAVGDSTDIPKIAGNTDPQPVIEWGDLKPLHERAAALGEKYGIEIYIGEECANQDNWDFQGDIMRDKATVENALNCLETAFESYPEGFVQQLKHSVYDKIKLYLTSSLQSVVEGTISVAGAYVSYRSDSIQMVFAAEEISYDNIYHELSHIIDSKLEFVSRFISTNYSEETWSSFNPSGFEYISYTAYNGIINDEYDKYIYDDNAARYFVDTYSLTAATEDRARIIESAMGGWSFWDDSDTKKSNLYRKLQYYASCIKEVFDMTGWAGDTVFERVLDW